MSQIAEGEQPPEKTEEQLQEEERQREEERKQQEQERKRLEEEARLKMEEDMKKLQQAVKGSVSGLGKTADNKTVAFVKMNLAEKELERIFPFILRFNQIQHLDLNTNSIADISVAADFRYLQTLNASKNQIPDLTVFTSEQKLLSLQFLNISGNKIKQLTKIALPSLKKLNVSENQIEKAEEWKGHASIQILQLRKNKLRKLKGIANMKKLTELYICQNQLTDIRGLENLPNLKKLSLRNNKLKGFMNPFPYLPALEYLNLRENQVASVKQLSKMDSHVRCLNLIANPVTDELGDNLKKEIIWQFPKFTKVNKSAVSEEDRISFEKERLEKIAQEQRQRLQKQEEARKAAEEAS